MQDLVSSGEGLVEEKDSPMPEKKGPREEEKKHTTNEPDPRIKTLDVGVWRIFYLDTPHSFLPGAETVRKFRELAQGVPYACRFLAEVWSIAPSYLVLWLLCCLWESVEGAMSLWITARLLETMQMILLNGKADMEAVKFALGLKFAFGLSGLIHGRCLNHCQATLRRRVTKHCGSLLLDIYTTMDLVTLQRKDVQNKLNKTSSTILGDSVWKNFSEMVGQVTGLLEIGSQGYFLFNFFRSQENGWLLAGICVLPRVLQGFMYSDKLGGVWFAHAINKAYLRLRSVGDTVQNKDFFEEILSSGMGRYLHEEYHKAMDSLGNVPYGNVYSVLWENRGPWKDLVNILLHDASLVYYLLAVAVNPSSFSLTSLTVLRESANSFAWTIWRLFQRDNSLNEKIRFIQDYYSLLALTGEVADGYIPYPAPQSVEFEGMKIEFRNVFMRYPKTTTYALRNVSFTIPAGAVVILVGENGSGKTTTVSLLSRLFDPTSGEIFIDDRPIKSYQVATLRDAQAILRQRYQHFPFSVKENIGMGDPNWLYGGEKSLRDVDDRIMRAAKLGGANDIVEEIKGKEKKRDVYQAVKGKESNGLAIEGTSSEQSGWDINVAPVETWVGSWQLRGSKLSDMSEEVEKRIELSGGQWQRLALARLFMRAERGQVRLVCTDEPSAALDPKAEFDVFKHLRTLQGRKTTKIFITHRFGHLTKHADLILCLKKGELVEAGTHDDLMKANGEYASLYNIQAQAFQAS